jgi:hypothetical protein
MGMTVGARRENREMLMCCGRRVEYPTHRRARRVGHMQTIKKDNRQARALPISQSVIRTPISAAAFVALSASSMRLLLEHQQGSQGGYFFSVDQVTLDKLTAANRPSETLSDVLIRMAKAEARASVRISAASGRSPPQAPAIYRH